MDLAGVDGQVEALQRDNRIGTATPTGKRPP
jgi:hypothetical protein